MKSNEGSWKLEKISDDKTKAIYTVEVGFGWLVPKQIAEQLTKVNLPQTLAAFKERAEKEAGSKERKEA